MNKIFVFSLLFLTLFSPVVFAEPLVTIYSPMNTTYPTTSIDLNWSANETLADAFYSLNGGSNVSFPTQWQNYSAIASGLGDVGVQSALTVFFKDDDWFSISGNATGDFNGFNWTGSAWQSDSAIASGLSDIGMYSTPEVFEKDSTWYLIAGEEDGVFNGFNWTGSAWQSDSAIASGLGDIGAGSTPEVFEKDSTWYLITGEGGLGAESGTFTGFNWTGSAWQSDSAIASGLGDVGSNSFLTVFPKDSTWYLIAGEHGGVFNGFNWTGSAWQSDSAIASGLGDIGMYSTPEVFEKDSTWYLIAGENDGVFYGFNRTIMNTTMTAIEGENNITVYANNTNGTIGSATQYFRVAGDINYSAHEYTPTPPNEDQDVELNVTLSESASTVVLEWMGTNNYTVTEHTGLEYSFNIGAGNYTAHDDVYWRWFATNLAGTTVSTQQNFTVGNQIPSVSAPLIDNENPDNDDTITCGGGVFSDLDDADTEDSREFVWYIDDVVIAGESSSTLDISTVSHEGEEQVICSTRVSDSYDYSSWTNSSNFATLMFTAGNYGEHEATYDTVDIVPIIFDIINEGLVLFVSFASLIAGVLVLNYIRKQRLSKAHK